MWAVSSTMWRSVAKYRAYTQPKRQKKLNSIKENCREAPELDHFRKTDEELDFNPSTPKDEPCFSLKYIALSKGEEGNVLGETYGEEWKRQRMDATYLRSSKGLAKPLVLYSYVTEIFVVVLHANSWKGERIQFFRYFHVASVMTYKPNVPRWFHRITEGWGRDIRNHLVQLTAGILEWLSSFYLNTFISIIFYVVLGVFLVFSW